jgi:hypothetical protein
VPVALGENKPHFHLIFPTKTTSVAMSYTHNNTSLPHFVLNHDFNKIFKIAKIGLDYAQPQKQNPINLFNLVKIEV